ncbi:MAG: glycogen/starch synthase [bacterium]
MKDPVKILFITQEIDPYLKESEISDICRKFPQYIQEKGFEIRTFMPCFGHINERRNQLHEVQRLSGMNIIIDDTDHPLIIKVASIQAARMQVYFIDNEDYFHRRGIESGEDGKEFDDNEERAIFFARSILETIKKLRWTPDIIHCNGWISSIAPIYIKKSYNSDPYFANSKVIYSVYKGGFEQNIAEGFDRKIQFEGIEPTDVQQLSKPDANIEDMHKLAIDYSDAIICGSDTISPEIERYINIKNKMYLPHSPEENFCEEYANLFNELSPVKTEED